MTASALVLFIQRVYCFVSLCTVLCFVSVCTVLCFVSVCTVLCLCVLFCVLFLCVLFCVLFLCVLFCVLFLCVLFCVLCLCARCIIGTYNKTNQMHLFLKFIFGTKLCIFSLLPCKKLVYFKKPTFCTKIHFKTFTY